MRCSILRIVPFGLLSAVLGGWALAVPAPPQLKELAPFQVDLTGIESHPNSSFDESDPITDLSFSPDSKTLYATIRHHGVRIWDVASRKCTGPDVDKELRLRVDRTIFSPDGKTAACLGERDIIVVLWDVVKRESLGRFMDDPPPLRLGVVFSPDGKTLSKPVRNLGEFELHIWDVEKRRLVRTCKAPGWLQTLAADSGVKTPVFVSTPRGDACSFSLVDAFTGRSVLTCEWDKSEGPPGRYFAMNRAETMVASMDRSAHVHLWDRNTGRRIARLNFRHFVCRGLAFIPDGTLLAAFYDDGGRGRPGEQTPDDCGFVLYDVRSGKVRADVKHLGDVSAWAFSPDNRLLAVKNDKEIKVWRIPDSWRR